MSNEIEGALVRMSLRGMWNAKENDEDITAEVHQKHGASEDSGNYRAELFPESACGKLNPHRVWLTSGHRLRTYHYKHTLPWQRGVQVVTAAFQAEYDSEMHRLWIECLDAGTLFFEWYPTGKQLAATAHNGSFNAELYPRLDVLVRKFKFELTFDPIPQAHHFAKTLAGAAIERARQEFEQRNERLVREAVNHAWKEILDPVMRLAQRLTEDQLVREDVVAGIRETLERVPALNLTNDPALREASEQIRQTLLGVTAAGLRDNPVQRLETAKQTIAVLKRFGNMGGGRKFA